MNILEAWELLRQYKKCKCSLAFKNGRTQISREMGEGLLGMQHTCLAHRRYSANTGCTDNKLINESEKL
jgi:hypothetical protein